MADYTAPVGDMKFVLEHVADLPRITDLPGFEHATPDMVDGILFEAARFFEEVVAPLNRVGDTQGSKLVDGAVVTPDGFKEAYAQYVAAGWGALPFPEAIGGGAFPYVVSIAVQEMLTSASMAFSLCPMLTAGAIEALALHGSEELYGDYVPRMITGEWSGTMNLTEPQAGSDLGVVTTKAVPVEDGTYRVTGQKIFITYGDHDMAENIIHLVLARTPDAPPGTKGISMFIVPKHLVNPDGSLGDRNDIRVVSLEHKLGIHASPTCVLSFGEEGGAIGYLVGEENAGMRYMFTMMNAARLAVGVEGLSIAERAYQQSLAFAKERRQGTALGAPKGEQSLIIKHPDVRRMLLTQRAYIEAMRCLMYDNAAHIDLAHHHPDPDVREEADGRAQLLTPLSKAWGTDLGVECTSLAIQVHGGMGYVEETGVAQHWRDSRIAPIYEGTNGIQAMDLVGRKLPLAGGEVIRAFIGWMTEVAGSARSVGLEQLGKSLDEGVAKVTEATLWIAGSRDDIASVLAGATPFLRLLAQVAGGAYLVAAAAAAVEADLDVAPDKVGVATFYTTQLMPQVYGLVPGITAGIGQLTAVAL